MNELQKRFNELSQEKRNRIQKILDEYKDSPCYKTPHEKQIESEVDQLRAENERLKARCFPSKIVMIEDSGHYVSESVFAEIERLKAELAEAKKDAELWRKREAKIKSLKERGFLKSPLRSEP